MDANDTNMRIEGVLGEIEIKAKKIGRPIRLMELCGTHAETIAKHGIKNLMPENIKLISGPGCPVCVSDQEDVDVVVGLAEAGISIATYGDAVGILGNSMSLEGARRNGADVSVVYDVTEALELKKQKPNLVFWGLGFETTTVATAWAITKGLTVFSSHKLFPPAMRALLGNKKIKVDGFIDPGHVSAIIGTKEYVQFSIPQVIAGFEAKDVLLAVNSLLDQIIKKENRVENEYARVVKENGNQKALKLMMQVFELRNSRWRGLGEIRNSGLVIRKKYQKQDASFVHQELITKIKKTIKQKPSACRCGEVLQGLIESRGCPLFGKVCTPDDPKGACMVSSEGSCNIEYRYDG